MSRFRIKRNAFDGWARILCVVIALAALTVPRQGRAEPMREFVLSASYGVLAGTLVGAATLAFSDKPGDNLNKVARGASIGLYAGILLGLYVVYGVPSGPDDDEAYLLHSQIQFRNESEQGSPGANPRVRVAYSSSSHMRDRPRWALVPLISDKGLEGASAQFALMRF